MVGRGSFRKKMITAMTAVIVTLAAPTSVFAVTNKTVQEVRDKLSTYHLSGVTADKLANLSIKEMLEKLNDPYTNFFTADEMKKFLSLVDNTYVGIGVRLNVDTKGVFIQHVFSSSPAEKAGVLTGDYIYAVNEEPISGLSTEEVSKRMLGKENTTMLLTVERNGKKLDLPMTRKQLQVPIITTKQFSNGVGYLALSTFASDADEQFAKALETFRKEDTNALILDFRNNGGGYVQVAENIASNFIREGVVLHTIDRNNQDEVTSIKDGKTFDKPVFILVNGESASATELLTGILQDYGKARVIGQQSFGKGVMQKTFALSEGNYIKITTNEYLTPKLHKVNKVGITPDDKVYGDLAQLIFALRSADSKPLKLEWNSKGYVLNGIEVDDGTKIERKDNQVYVPARTIAALIGATITWNEKRGAVELTTDQGTTTFQEAPGSMFMSEKGIAYLDIAKLMQATNRLTFKDTNNQVTFEVVKE
ncbi:S41 family peptidase [Paenibacillus sp. KN14-4R]|uniref:S41 family peptidase n=1 Tax=Paenibacillus sp. KN14-4R TaxID=3445773 RepID=UPI003FA00D7E